VSDDLDLDLAGASIRADRRDVPAFVSALAVRLEQAVPGLVEVQRKRAGLFSGEKVVRRIACTVGEESYVLDADADGRTVVATCGKTVRGIVIRTEMLPVAEWAQRLVAALGREADTSAEAYRALHGLVA
jgi:hypothetical protein